jgi:SAM-dependent methyltransferase
MPTDRSPTHDALREFARAAYGQDIGGYTTGRPEYPDAVYQLLRTRCGLMFGSRVVESGPGSGQATRRLVEMGAHVVCVEPDPAMAAYLAGAFGDRISVVNDTLEKAELEAGSFDLAVAATSFDWVEQEVGLGKMAGFLKPGGWLALWWTVFADPERPDPFMEALTKLVGEADIGRQAGFRFPFERSARTKELETAGFVDLQLEIFPWTGKLTSAQIRALFGSMMDVHRRPPRERMEILDAVERVATDTFGGAVARPFVTVMYTGRKAGFFAGSGA